LRIVFFGSSAFACPALNTLDEEFGVQLVVTQPDRPWGRRAELMPTDVKRLALARGLPIVQPENVNAPESVERIAGCSPDVIVVASYGQLLRPVVFQLPSMGTINIHASLLPAYRGAAPVNWSIIHGETVTGITTFLIEQGLDTGDILCSAALAIDPEETAGDLERRLAVLASDVIVQTLEGIQAGTVQPTPQPEQGVSLAPSLTRADGRIQWDLPALQVHNRVRGTAPWPGAWTLLNGRRVKIHRTRLTDVGVGRLRPGEFGPIESRCLLVATEDRLIEVLELQCEGKCCLCGWDFLQGCRPPMAFSSREETDRQDRLAPDTETG
jgi:methionyl-tRNA formyltransferase